MAKKTQDTFHTWDWFVRELNKAFGDLDQRNTAARELNNLRQRGSVTKYMAEFQRHAMRLGYDDEALKDKFYNGLKDFVKDEISRSDKPTTLEGLIELAVRIDNRQYERSLERRGGYDPRSRQNKKSGRHGRQGDPMELDATRKDITKQERDRRRRENLCYECGMPGHRASSHGKGKSPRQGKNSRRNGQASATRREEYQQISATNRTPLMPTEEELEEQMIHTQLQERDWEYDSQGDPIGSEGPDEENCGCNGCGAINCSGCSGPVGLDEERVAGRAVLDMIFGRIGMRYTSPEPLEQDDTDSEESSVASNSGNEGSVTLAEIAFGETASTTENEETREPQHGEPQKGEVWEVCQREVFSDLTGTREWYRAATNTTYKEPGKAMVGGPSWGQQYIVAYKDHKRIGWKEVAGTGTYMQHIPRDLGGEEMWIQPQEGERWELIAKGAKSRLWMSADQAEDYYREDIHPQDEDDWVLGHVYEVLRNGQNTRLWWNVLKATTSTEKFKQPRELNATGGSGQLFCTIRICGKTAGAMIDSGATGNFISPTAVSKMGLRTQVKMEPYTLRTVDGSTIDQDNGIVRVETPHLRMSMHQGHEETISFDVVPLGGHQVILGMPWMKKHNPTIDWTRETIRFERCSCTKYEPQSQKSQQDGICHGISATTNDPGYAARDPLLKQIPIAQKEKSSEENAIPQKYERFRELFKEELGSEALPKHGPWDHEIPLEEGKEPPFLPIYHMSADDLRTLKEYIDVNLAKGFIRESSSKARAPILFVPKSNGKKRLCVDYRRLNAITKKDRYALPLANELMDRLQGAKIFTKLDLRGGYNHIRIKEGEEWKTAFGTRYGHYEYTVMPFGLCNAPASFMRMMNEILRPFLDKFCICYLDDIMIYSKDVKEHVSHVTQVLEKLKEWKLRCEPSKCEFHITETRFLGFVVSCDGLAMDQRKVSSVLEWKEPRNVTEVQSFLGLANYYRRFIQGYSKIATPLTELTKKENDFKWDIEEQKAFDRLKKAFTEAPVLITFDPEKPITVETDASDYAVGAVLSQPGLSKK
jgi:hypothetical protein